MILAVYLYILNMFDFGQETNVEDDPDACLAYDSMSYVHSMRLFKSSEDEFRTVVERGAMVYLLLPIRYLADEVLSEVPLRNMRGTKSVFHSVTIYDGSTKSHTTFQDIIGSIKRSV